jgi:isopropylmalate/homocitrate/citramalate synthase
MVGAPVVPSAVAELGDAVASVTDPQVARSIIERLPHSAPRTTEAAAFARDYQKLLDELVSAKGPWL